MPYLVYFYPIIIVLGIITSYTDIKFRKIKNKHLFVCALCGLIIYAYLIANQQITLNIKLLLNPALGLVIGFLLYFTHTWGAGDAKLFFVYSLLMPTEKYAQIIPLPSLLLFINIFLISTIAILILSIKQIIENKNLILNKLFSSNSFYRLFYSFLIVFTIGWPISLLTNLLRPYATTFLVVLILYFSYLFLYSIVNKMKKKYLIFIIFGLGLIFRFIIQPQDFTPLYLLSYLKVITSYTLLFYLLGIIFELNKSKENERIIPFAPLMFLGTLAANSNLIYHVMQVLNALRK